VYVYDSFGSRSQSLLTVRCGAKFTGEFNTLKTALQWAQGFSSEPGRMLEEEISSFELQRNIALISFMQEELLDGDFTDDELNELLAEYEKILDKLGGENSLTQNLEFTDIVHQLLFFDSFKPWTDATIEKSSQVITKSFKRFKEVALSTIQKSWTESPITAPQNDTALICSKCIGVMNGLFEQSQGKNDDTAKMLIDELVDGLVFSEKFKANIEAGEKPMYKKTQRIEVYQEKVQVD